VLDLPHYYHEIFLTLTAKIISSCLKNIPLPSGTIFFFSHENSFHEPETGEIASFDFFLRKDLFSQFSSGFGDVRAQVGALDTHKPDQLASAHDPTRAGIGGTEA
jgi:hypothetical protein